MANMKTHPNYPALCLNHHNGFGHEDGNDDVLGEESNNIPDI
jgi:hypothetical protein